MSISFIHQRNSLHVLNIDGDFHQVVNNRNSPRSSLISPLKKHELGRFIVERLSLIHI